MSAGFFCAGAWNPPTGHKAATAPMDEATKVIGQDIEDGRRGRWTSQVEKRQKQRSLKASSSST